MSGRPKTDNLFSLSDNLFRHSQGIGDLQRILPSGLGEIGTPPATSTHDHGQLLQDLSSVVPMSEVVADKRNQMNIFFSWAD